MLVPIHFILRGLIVHQSCILTYGDKHILSPRVHTIMLVSNAALPGKPGGYLSFDGEVHKNLTPSQLDMTCKRSNDLTD